MGQDEHRCRPLFLCRGYSYARFASRVADRITAYDDGVAFRYRLLGKEKKFTIRDEVTRFDVVGGPMSMFNTLSGFTTSHESLYERKPFTAIPTGQLLDCPLLLMWPEGPAAAITEARVRDFAGMYLEREAGQNSGLRCRLSPLPSDNEVSVMGETPHASPWRVILLADRAGKMVESNLLLCLNDLRREISVGRSRAKRPSTGGTANSKTTTS